MEWTQVAYPKYDRDRKFENINISLIGVSYSFFSPLNEIL